jgi:hypothetical protein
MKRLFFALACGVATVPMVACAADVKPPLELRPKAALMAAVPHGSAPFVVPATEPELSFAPPRNAREAQGPSSCTADRDLCYDANAGHIVFKPARQYMPELPGMTPENISLKRDRIVFRYSF